MKIETWPIDKVIPYARNPRKNDASVDAVAASIKEFGWRVPIVVDEAGVIITGHTRLKAARRLGMKSVPVHVATDLTPAQVKAYRIADNSAGSKSEWDADLLKIELDDLPDFDAAEFNLDLDALGMDDAPEGEADAEPQVDRAEELNKKWKVKTGDLWMIGEHRLLCGDSTKREDVERATDGETCDLCLTDPPYGVGLDYATHDDTESALRELAHKWFPLAREVSRSMVFSPGVTRQWLYPEPAWVFCWFYGGGSFMSSWGFNCWQPFLCYGKDPSLASGNGRRPDAIDMNTPANAGELGHPCPKPMKLWHWMIERLTFKEWATIFDPFLGSGTTMVAAQNLGRKCYGLEISPAYCAVILERMITAFPYIDIRKAK